MKAVIACKLVARLILPDRMMKLINKNYRNDPKFLDGHVKANL